MSQHRTITAAMIANELDFVASRSSGPGGQNVNKVNTKVTVRFDISASLVLSQDEKDTLFHKLEKQLTREGVLVFSSQEKRSQLQNKEEVIQKLVNRLNKAFERRKKRKVTKPSKRAVENRITKKKRISEKKKWRRGVD